MKTATKKDGFVLRQDGSLLTPPFRVSFPRIFTADENGKFGCAMIFDEDVDFSVLEKAVKDKEKEVWPKGAPKKEYLLPILDGGDSNREEHKGKFYINGKAGKYRPGLVDAQLQPIMDEAEFYPGCWARAVITLYHWVYLGKCGISVNIRNIQKIRDDEPLVSRMAAKDEFETVTDETVSDL
jgi:hypothetical protein